MRSPRPIPTTNPTSSPVPPVVRGEALGQVPCCATPRARPTRPTGRPLPHHRQDRGDVRRQGRDVVHRAPRAHRRRGPELVARIFERRRRRRVEAVRHHLDGKNLAEKVDALAVLLDAEGYLADTDGSSAECFHINLHSCPIWDVAAQFGQACTSELEFIRDLIPEARVERVTHKAIGAHTCMYEIHP